MKRRSFLGYALLFIGGCTAATETSPSSTAPLTLSITDEKGLEPLQDKFEPFREAIANLLDRPVAFYPVETTTAAAAGLQSGAIDLALAGPTEYVLIRARTNAIPVFAITRPNYHSVAIVPQESEVQTLEDLREKTVAMSDLGSTSGHLGPTTMLVEAGLNPQTDYQVQFLGDEGSLEALKQRQVAAWFGSLTDYENFLEGAEVNAEDYRQIAKSPSLPNDVILVNSQTQTSFIETFRQQAIEADSELIAALTAVSANDKYVGSQIVSVSDAEYDTIREAYRAIGQGNFIE